MNKRNWAALLLVCAIAITSFQSCSKDDDDTTTPVDDGPTEWVRTTVLPAGNRNGAASFVINDEGYMVGGFQATRAIVNETWAFSGQWNPKADFIGPARHTAVGFAIDGKGFVGTGFDGSDALKDFYSYDAGTDTWEQIADFPGNARFGAIAFALDGYGYVGLGQDPTGMTYSDLYRYNPATDEWEFVPTDFTWAKAYSFVFVIGNKAYIGGGLDNGQYPEEFHSFDGTNWERLADLNRNDNDHTYDVRRHSTAAFAIGNNGYIVSGRAQNGVINNVWKYNPSSDSWSNEHQAFQGSAREKAVGFTLDGKGYVTTGSDSNGANFFRDNWQFTPVR